MPKPPVPDDRPASPPVSAPDPAKPNPSPRQILTLIAAAGLILSFFLPWITLFGAKFSGLDIQRHFSSYRLVWIVPLLAVIALVANLARLPARTVNQLAASSPFLILIYAAYRMEGRVADLLKLLEYGAWLALLCGLTLEFAGRAPKKPTPTI